MMRALRLVAWEVCMFTSRVGRSLGLFALAVGASWLFTSVSFGQVLFEDDFNDGEIDTAKWRIDDKPYETGAGEYEAVEADGVVTISGRSTQNWWAGLALATIPTFSASADGYRRSGSFLRACRMMLSTSPWRERRRRPGTAARHAGRGAGADQGTVDHVQRLLEPSGMDCDRLAQPVVPHRRHAQMR